MSEANHIREMRQIGDISTRDPAAILLVDDILEMKYQGFVVGMGLGDPFGDLDDDGTEAGSIEVDFLVVGDFADVAVVGKRGRWISWIAKCMIETQKLRRNA